MLMLSIMFGFNSTFTVLLDVFIQSDLQCNWFCIYQSPYAPREQTLDLGVVSTMLCQMSCRNTMHTVSQGRVVLATVQ